MPHNPPPTPQGEPLLAHEDNGYLLFHSGFRGGKSWTDLGQGFIDLAGETHKSGSSNRFVIDLRGNQMKAVK